MAIKFLGQLGFLAAILLVLTLLDRPDGRLHVVFLPTKGDAMLIQTPSGQHILIDGGADPAAVTSGLGIHLPFWKRHLDAVILTLPDHAHLPGQIATLARYRANIVFTSRMTKHNALVAEWQRLLMEQRTPVRLVQTGMQFRVDGVIFQVLAEGDGSETGPIIQMSYDATRVIFDHNGDEGAEEALASTAIARASLLAFPWQRDPHNTFVAAVQPKTIVFTDGFAADTPVQQTMMERSVGDTQLYHEQLHGAIEWISDGKQSWVRVERNN